MKRKEFELLDLIRQQKPYRQDSKTLSSLIKSGYVKNGQLTVKGKNALLPYKVDNAVIMAAGKSTRLLPYTIEKPKGLLTIKGEVLIERQIKQIFASGITQIVIVVGYQKEKFDYLKKKLKNIKIVFNPYFDERNNLDSLIFAKPYLRNSYICSSDNYYAINPFKAYKYESSYATVTFNEKLVESYVLTDKNNYIIKMLREQPSGDVMMGYAYWSSDFSKAFMRLAIKNRYSPKYSQLVWERLYKDNINKLPKLHNDNFPHNIIFEFDSLEDVKSFDKNFADKSPIIDNITRILKCKKSDIKNFELIKGGLTNITFSFVAGKNKYFYRHPGKGTERIISRSHERICCEHAKKLNFEPSYIYMDPQKGFKISNFISKYRYPTPTSKIDNIRVARLLRKLHDSKQKVDWVFDPVLSAIKIKNMLSPSSLSEIGNDKKIFNYIKKISVDDKKYKINKCLCHCDADISNFLIINKTKMYLIDWEYGAMSDPAVDVATYIMKSEWSVEQATSFIKYYLGKNYSKQLLNHYLNYVVIISYYWLIWSLERKENGAKIGNIQDGPRYKTLIRFINYVKKFKNLAIK